MSASFYIVVEDDGTETPYDQEAAFFWSLENAVEHADELGDGYTVCSVKRLTGAVLWDWGVDHGRGFQNACGCPFGVMEFAGETQGEAWREFYEGSHRSVDLAVGRAVAAGVTVALVPHERYVAEFYPQMTGEYRCPHRGTS